MLILSDHFHIDVGLRLSTIACLIVTGSSNHFCSSH
jgi:hypothetical protein